MKSLFITILVFSSTCCLFAGDLIEDIRKQIADTSRPITLIVDLPLPDELAKAFEVVAADVVKNEPDTLRYLVFREPDTHVVTVVETYKNLEALQAHLDRPVIKEFIAKMEAAEVPVSLRIFENFPHSR